MIEFPFSNKAERLILGALSSDRIFVFPTETFYGIGGNAMSESVVERIYKIKGRSRKKSFLLLVNNELLNQVCFWNDSRVKDLMEAFWPGPLTLILEANKALPKHLQNLNGTIAIRYSSSPVAQRLIELGNCPVIGTSANLSGMPECSTIKEVKKQFYNRVDIIIDGGNMLQNKPSTIVDCQSKTFKILRHGAINLSDLNRICDVV